MMKQRSSTSVHGAPLREIQLHTPTTLMRGATEKQVIPRFELLANSMQQQKNH